jgi:hypothetical protein
MSRILCRAQGPLPIKSPFGDIRVTVILVLDAGFYSIRPTSTNREAGAGHKYPFTLHGDCGTIAIDRKWRSDHGTGPDDFLIARMTKGYVRFRLVSASRTTSARLRVLSTCEAASQMHKAPVKATIRCLVIT